MLDGGTGEDKLVGGEGDDVLRGGDGNDTIEGKDGGDRIDAGAGDDLLAPDGYEHANADGVDGGPGTDRIEGDYSSRFSDTDPPVAITFGGGADDGRPGEGDDLRSVEKVWLNVGGTFTGTDGADEFRLSQVGTPSTHGPAAAAMTACAPATGPIASTAAPATTASTAASATTC